MSLGRCIPDMVKRGEIDATRAKRMQELFDELNGYYRRSMGPDAAAAEASEATLRQMAREARQKKRQQILQANRMKAAARETTRFTGKNRYAAIAALLDDDDRAPYRDGNVTTAATRIEFQAQAQISEFIERHRRNLLGQPKEAEALNDVIRALHGQDVSDVRARTAAQAIGEAFEQLRQRFNQAGGDIRRLDGWGLTHRHDPLKVRGATREQWIADVMPALDRAKMLDDRTGAPLTDDRLTTLLTETYERIRTNGLTGDASAVARGNGKLGNQRQEHRFLHFRDGDAWLAYNSTYGAAENPFVAITGHISGMAKDIAMMERLGPNPDATIRFLLDGADKAEAQSGKRIVGSVQGYARGRAMVENLWRYIKGDINVPVLPESRAGYYVLRTVQGTRNLLTSAMLGSAPLSAISDVHTGAMARGFYGLPEAKVLGGYLKQLNPASDADRKLAVRLGAGMHDAAQSMTSIARFYGEAHGPGWTQVLADSVLRVSGLNKFTEAGQNAFVLDLLGSLGDVRDREWAALPEGLRTAMERNGIENYDWQHIRGAAPIEANGATYIDPTAINDRGVSDRLMNMVLRGRSAAVQESSATSRALATGGTQAGTFFGEVLRNSVQFKGFAIALMLKQGRMMAALPPGKRALYGAQFVIGMTMFGAAAIQLREIAKGRDPRPMDDSEFWGDALMQGGGLGIAGDLIGTFTNDRIGGPASFLGGPMVALADDLRKAGFMALPGEERQDGTRRAANPGGAAVMLAKRYTPGTSLWYARAAFERTIIDLLDENANPEFAAGRARQARAAKENKQGYWWAPGDRMPSRTPSLSTATEPTQAY